MNIIKIHGGLGNQLFQYSFGLYLQKKLGTHVKFDLNLDLKNKNFTSRSLDIEKLGIYLPLASDKEILHNKRFYKKIWRVERKLINLFPALNRSYVVRNSPHIDFPIQQNTYYDGYFQRWEYVKEILEILYQNISISDVILKENSSIIQDIENQDITAIHIRRDDYLNIPVNAKIFQVCGMDYYNLAINTITRKTNSQKFLIFTQDKIWAREHFKDERFIIFNGKSAIEDFIIMMRCKNQIIANSTFSWWAAVLNLNFLKTVVYPRNWYKNDLYTLDDFIPNKWIGI